MKSTPVKLLIPSGSIPIIARTWEEVYKHPSVLPRSLVVLHYSTITNEPKISLVNIVKVV